ncbi:hypothetical protein CJ010_15855 [Azoarcus sp. DD4]|uniref:hypothetical protein n=1 Tax=Azoarcus sp. DD4 TaxID=2027405 RepID=UPI00112E6E59|nr:hypothetical protein [Azoarcus sp. DD4]QDF97900.1 hypothetical protein CJ010_15855 [Azoarcus sp. DD4]
MRFNLFEPRIDAHIRKAQDYLNEANLARLEHQVAAEHHAALAKMYAERAARLEMEINSALQRSLNARPRSEDAKEPPERAPADAAPLYPLNPARNTRA